MGGAASDGLCCSRATDGSAGVFGVGEGDVHVRAVLLGNLVLHVHQAGEFFFMTSFKSPSLVHGMTWLSECSYGAQIHACET